MVSIRQKSIQEKGKRSKYLRLEQAKKYHKFLKINARRLGWTVIQEFPRSSSIKNYCLLSGSARSIYSSFRLSRHQVKKYFRFLTLRASSF